MKTNTKQRKMSNTRKVIKLENKMIKDEIIFSFCNYDLTTGKSREELTNLLRGI